MMPVDEQVADAYDFSVFGTLVAPGGEHAGFLMTVLKRNPALKGILFDRREGIAQARKQVAHLMFCKDGWYIALLLVVWRDFP